MAALWARLNYFLLDLLHHPKAYSGQPKIADDLTCCLFSFSYCECFAAGVYCSEPCSCHDCFNKPVHEDTVLATRKQIESRNPLAFAPKVIRNSETVLETRVGNTAASALVYSDILNQF